MHGLTLPRSRETRHSTRNGGGPCFSREMRVCGSGLDATAGTKLHRGDLWTARGSLFLPGYFCAEAPNRTAQAEGCLRISDKARRRDASAGDFAMAASFSSDGAMRCRAATFFLFMCELSAPAIALRKESICSAGKALDRES